MYNQFELVGNLISQMIALESTKIIQNPLAGRPATYTWASITQLSGSGRQGEKMDEFKWRYNECFPCAHMTYSLPARKTWP